MNDNVKVPSIPKKSIDSTSLENTGNLSTMSLSTNTLKKEKLKNGLTFSITFFKVIKTISYLLTRLKRFIFYIHVMQIQKGHEIQANIWLFYFY